MAFKPQKKINRRRIMGNPDLIVVINGLAWLISGKEYINKNAAILQAITSFDRHWEDLMKIVPDPDKLRGKGDIKEIKVYELIG